MRFFLLFLFCCLSMGSAAMAKGRPSVYMLSPGVDAGTIKLLEQKSDGPVALDSMSGSLSDSEALLTRLQQLKQEGLSPSDLVLLQCLSGKKTEQENTASLREAVRLAREMKMEPLWMTQPLSEGTDAELENTAIVSFNGLAARIMAEEEVSVMDFQGFSAVPLRPNWTVGRAQAEYFAEAFSQWWWVCSRENPLLHREMLWPGPPPEYKKSGAERINKTGRVDNVTMPEIVRYVSPVEPSGAALIYFPGGGYGQMGFLRNVNGLGEKLSPLGITLFALKYRTGRGDEVPLLDAQRAVRWVRAHAGELNIDPDKIGVAGISAGANLTLNLISHSSPGNAGSDDPVERFSSRPDFAVVLTSWHHGEKKSPFTFTASTPPVFLRHARDDSGFALAEDIVAQLQKANIPLNFKYLDKGGHGAFDQGPDSIGQNWTEEFIPWLEGQNIFRRPEILKP